MLRLCSLLLASATILLACPEGPFTPPGPVDAGQPLVDAGPDARGLVFPATATGCELLLREESGVLHVDFGTETTGTLVREAPFVAVALVGTAGELEAEVSGAFTLESSRCVNDNGADIDGSVEVRR